MEEGNDTLGGLNPAGMICWKVHMPSVAALLHPQYLLHKMEYKLPNGAFCPILGRDAKRLTWKLDGDLRMIPTSVEVL